MDRENDDFQEAVMETGLSPRALRAIGELERLAETTGRDGGNYRETALALAGQLRAGEDVLTGADDFVRSMGGWPSDPTCEEGAARELGASHRGTDEERDVSDLLRDANLPTAPEHLRAYWRGRRAADPGDIRFEVHEVPEPEMGATHRVTIYDDAGESTESFATDDPYGAIVEARRLHLAGDPEGGW